MTRTGPRHLRPLRMLIPQEEPHLYHLRHIRGLHLRHRSLMHIHGLHLRRRRKHSQGRRLLLRRRITSWPRHRLQHHQSMATLPGQHLPHHRHTTSPEQSRRHLPSTLISPSLRYRKISRREIHRPRRHLPLTVMLPAKALLRRTTRLLRARLATARMRRSTTGTNPAPPSEDKDPTPLTSHSTLNFPAMAPLRLITRMTFLHICPAMGLQLPMTLAKRLLAASMRPRLAGTNCRRPALRRRFHPRHLEAT